MATRTTTTSPTLRCYVFAVVPFQDNVVALLMADSADGAPVEALGRAWKSEEWALEDGRLPNMPPPSKSVASPLLRSCLWAIPALLGALIHTPGVADHDVSAPSYDAVPYDGALTWLAGIIIDRSVQGCLSRHMIPSLLSSDDPDRLWDYALSLPCQITILDEVELVRLLERVCAQMTAITIQRRMPCYWRDQRQDAGRTLVADVRHRGITEPLSLLDTVQTRLVESDGACPPLCSLPKDIAEPLAFAIWQRACAAAPSTDRGAHRLADVARYWGLTVTDTDPQRVCTLLVQEALKREPTRSRAVPVPYRMPIAVKNNSRIDPVRVLLGTQTNYDLRGATSRRDAIHTAESVFVERFGRTPIPCYDDVLLDRLVALILDPRHSPTRKRWCSCMMRARLALIALCQGIHVAPSDLTSVGAAQRLFTKHAASDNN